jgi:hypothetical protein
MQLFIFLGDDHNKDVFGSPPTSSFPKIYRGAVLDEEHMV